MRFGLIVGLLMCLSVPGVQAAVDAVDRSGTVDRERYEAQRPVPPAKSDGIRSGSLFDTAVLVQSFADVGGLVGTPSSADNDGNYHYIIYGGGTTGDRFSRYLLNGTLDITAAPGVDFRSLVTDNNGNLFAKGFGSPGNFYSITSDGVATLLFTIADSDGQTSASFNGDDSELYTMDAGTIYRYDSATGAPLGSFTLLGMTAGELAYPDEVQMETTPDGRILTYSDGVVSEWDVGGNRIGQCTVPIATPTDFSTEFSFAVGGTGMVYLYNASSLEWEIYDVGAEVPVELMSFSVE